MTFCRKWCHNKKLRQNDTLLCLTIVFDTSIIKHLQYIYKGKKLKSYCSENIFYVLISWQNKPINYIINYVVQETFLYKFCLLFVFILIHINTRLQVLTNFYFAALFAVKKGNSITFFTLKLHSHRLTVVTTFYFFVLKWGNVCINVWKQVI